MAFHFFWTIICHSTEVHAKLKSGKTFTPVGFGSLRKMNSSAFKKGVFFIVKNFGENKAMVVTTLILTMLSVCSYLPSSQQFSVA